MGIQIKDMPVATQAERVEKDKLSARAKAVGLSNSSTEEEVVAAEEAKNK